MLRRSVSLPAGKDEALENHLKASVLQNVKLTLMQNVTSASDDKESNLGVELNIACHALLSPQRRIPDSPLNWKISLAPPRINLKFSISFLEVFLKLS